MRTVTFKSVLWGVAYRLGLDPATNLQANQAAALAEYINSWLRAGWEEFNFPGTTEVEERYFHDAVAYSAAATYGADDEVYDAATNAYYRSLVGGNHANAVTDATKWALIEDMERWIALDQTGQEPIWDVTGVFLRNPLTNRSVGEFDYQLTGDRLYVDAAASGISGTVWVKFQTGRPEFTSDVYASATSYAVGDLVYDSDSGECYESLAASNQGNTVTDATKWRKVNFPYVLAEFVKCMAQAIALEDDGQYDKATLKKADAAAILNDEMWKVSVKQNQAQRYRVATRS